MKFQVQNLDPFGVKVTAESDKTLVSHLPIAEIRTLAREHHLVLLRGFSTFEKSDEFAEYCEGWGEVSRWPFGKVLELVEQENPQDHIFDSNFIGNTVSNYYRFIDS